MKKMSEIMEDLGFNADASDGVKKAFIKNLIREAQASEFKRAKENNNESKENSVKVDESSLPVQTSLFDQKISG